MCMRTCLNVRLGDNYFNFQQVNGVYCVVINDARPINSKILHVILWRPIFGFLLYDGFVVAVL